MIAHTDDAQVIRHEVAPPAPSLTELERYGSLSGVARHRINTDLIARHWDDLLRVAGSLKVGPVLR